MEDKLLRMLGGLEYIELMRLKRDVDSGALLLQHIMNKKINELENMHRKTCASCGKDMHQEKDDMYTLLFGEKTIRKKASFCGLDCLENFTTILKDGKYQINNLHQME